MTLRAVVACSCLVAACSSRDADDAPTTYPTTFGGDRPAELNVPGDFDPAHSYPLVVVLHGYGINGLLEEGFFGFDVEVNHDDALEIAPDGETDSLGLQYWNADPACCDMDHANPDDVGYLGGLIDDIRGAYPVSDVFVVGHSNGGYMAYRMACERGDAISAIGVLAGIVTTDAAACHPAKPVAVLHMHGTDDDNVPYAQTADYPGAAGSVARWAGYDGCGSAATAGPALDLDSSVDGAETTSTIYSGCAAPVGVELWTLTGSTHVPEPSPAFEPSIWAWLTAHAR